MRIALLAPPVEQWEEDFDFLINARQRKKFIKPKPIAGIMPCFSLLYLASAIKQEGRDIKYFEPFHHTVETLISELKTFDPHIIGISSLTFNWAKTKNLAHVFRQEFPDITIIAGGVHPTSAGAQCIEECPAIDVIVLGEAEETFPEILDRIENMGKTGILNLYNIPGAVWRDREGVHSNPPGQPPDNLDALPFPDRDLIRIENYCPSPMHYAALPHTSIIGARGCPFSCIFCHTDARVRMRSAENIADEIEYVINKYGIRDLSLWDDTFTLNRKRVYEFCDELNRRRIRIYWSVNVRADTVDYSVLKLMKSAGCWRVLMGIETGVQKNLDTLFKELRLDDVVKAVEFSRRAGVKTLGSFMFGIPGETFEDALETIKFASSIPLDYVYFGYFTPFPGTKAFEDIAKNPSTGKIIPGAKFDLKNITYLPSSMTEKELRILPGIALRKFYFRLTFILKKLLQIRSFEDIKNYANAFFNLSSY